MKIGARTSCKNELAGFLVYLNFG